MLSTKNIFPVDKNSAPENFQDKKKSDQIIMLKCIFYAIINNI